MKEISAANTHGIRNLTDFSHARIKSTMYLGSDDPHTQVVLEYPNGHPQAIETTWVPALYTALREIIDNSLDEIIGHGHGDRIDITYDPTTMVISVSDNGRGIPIDIDKATKQHLATMVMSNARAGRNFDERGHVRGTNGIGASVVNFCSEWFEMDIWRDEHHFAQRFSESKGDALIIDPPIILPLSKAIKKRGTRIEFKLSQHVFKNMLLPEKFVKARVYEIAVCYPKLKIYYNGERIAVKKTIIETLFADHQPITFIIRDGTFSSNFWLVPDFTEDGETSHSLVNAIPLFDGGIHIDVFRRLFFIGLLTALERESKRRKLVPNRNDIVEGLLIYNITEMDAPNFNSQSKTRLINEEAGIHIKKALDDDFFKTLIKQNDAWINRIYERCELRTMKKDTIDVNKLAKRNLRNKVPELEDACGLDRSKCILFLAEGRSAIAGLNESRDPEIHGGLKLRGKVLNVHGEPHKVVLENAALANVMSAIGLVPGQRANRHALRYGRVYLAVDMDPDGANIAALLINFFYNLWPELFDPLYQPFVHVFLTPFIIAIKGKTRKYWYGQDYLNFDPEQYKTWEITRAKGLAALKKEDWDHALANPQLMPLIDDGQISEALDLIFHEKRTNDRKVWIGL